MLIANFFLTNKKRLIRIAFYLEVIRLFIHLGRNKGIEPLHNRATIYRVNHFTNSAITVNRISKKGKKSNTLLKKYDILIMDGDNNE